EDRLDRMHTLNDPTALDALARELTLARGATADTPAAFRAVVPRPYVVPPYVAPGAAVVPFGLPRRSFVVMGDQKHGGALVMSARWEFRSIMSSVRLDLREARFDADACELDLFAMMSNYEILVPASVALATDIGGVMAAIDTPQLARGVPPAVASLRISGMAVMSNVEVRVAPVWMPADAPFKAAWRAAQLKD
ncbi:MAG TPA: hypothetical protein VGD56_05080, partial [Gemmatirosa sp.]